MEMKLAIFFYFFFLNLSGAEKVTQFTSVAKVKGNEC